MYKYVQSIAFNCPFRSDEDKFKPCMRIESAYNFNASSLPIREI